MKKTFKVTGMSCAACSARVEKAVRALEGAAEVNVNLLTGTMTLEAGPLSDEEIVQAVVKAGYGAFPQTKTEKTASALAGKETADELKTRKRILIWSLVLLLPLLYVSMGHMLGLELPKAVSKQTDPASYALLQLLLALPVVILNGSYYTRGFRALARRSPNMDSLIAVGSAASLIYGAFTLFRINAFMRAGDLNGAVRAAGGLYFESAAMIPALIDLGKYLEALSRGKTTDALRKLTELAPTTALRETAHGVEEIPASEVRPGDVLQVRPGSRIPADGTILEGGAGIDESMLTGESMPVFKSAGDRVSAATVDTDAFFRLRVEKTGEDTAFSRIVRMVEEASASKPPISRLADKVAGVFVPAVMGIALITLGVHLLIGHTFSRALTRAISVLVVSCPCALGLATPVAVMVGTGRGARKGILIRGGDALETAGRIDTLVTDKTGTLTYGKPVVTAIRADGISERELLRLAYSAERMSEHPLSRALCTCAEAAGIPAYPASGFENRPGQGISARVDGRAVRCGNAAWFRDKNTEPFRAELERAYEAGETPILVEADGRVRGVICCADAIKPTSASAVRELENSGIRVHLLTGDNTRTARTAAHRMGISQVISDVLPGEKAQIVDRLRGEGKRVAMLGDGINDAPALKTADVGIAIGAGTDVALESADVILMNNDPADAVGAVLLSRAVVKNIKQNLFWAFFYNTLMIPVAAGALESLGIVLSPMLSAAAMSLSSLFVVSNALRLNRFRFPQAETVYEDAPNPYQLAKEETKMIVLKVDGMMCMHCVAHVKKALESLEGVTAEVSLEKGEAYVTGAEESDREKLIKAVTDAGYEAK